MIFRFFNLILFRFFIAKLVEKRTSIYTVNGQTRSRTECIPHNQKSIMFRRRVDLLNCKATLHPGIYVYPFKFKLDENLPGSFSINKGDTFGKIVYKLKAEVMRPGRFQANIKHTQYVQLSTRLSRPIQSIQTSSEANVTRLCCIDMGSVSLSVILDKNAYSPGDVANLTIAIDNSASDVTLKHVAFKLVNRVNMRANTYSQSFRDSACNNQAPSVPKGDTAHIQFSLNLPYHLTPTTVSSLINSFYEFEVVLSIPCSADVIMRLPVTIFAPAPIDYISTVQYPTDRPPQYQQAIEIKPEMFKIY